MPLTTGLVLNGDHSLAEICSSLAAEFARCFWVVDSASGPFDLWSGGEFDQNERLVEGQRWEILPLANTSSTGLRPGTIPKFADRLIVDEWSYYFAIDAPEPLAIVRAGVIAAHIGDLSEAFLRDLDRFSDLLICRGDGWWEFYCGRADWCDRLRSAWPDCLERALTEAGTPPAIGRTSWPGDAAAPATRACFTEPDQPPPIDRQIPLPT